MTNIPMRLQHFEMFRNLSERDLIELSSFMEMVSLKGKETVFKKGRPITDIFLVLTGSVKIQDCISGKKTKIFNFLGRGEFLGVAVAGLPNPQYPATARCNEDSSFLRIPINFFFKALMQIPEVRFEVNRQISQRFLEFQNDACTFQRLTPCRVAGFLLRLVDRQRPELRNRVQIPLTRSDIGQRVGAQNETVVRILSHWTKQGWIKTDDRHIEIVNRAELERLEHDSSYKKTAK